MTTKSRAFVAAPIPSTHPACFSTSSLFFILIARIRKELA